LLSIHLVAASETQDTAVFHHEEHEGREDKERKGFFFVVKFPFEQISN